MRANLLFTLIVLFQQPILAFSQDTVVVFMDFNRYYEVKFPNGFKESNLGLKWIGQAELIELCDEQVDSLKATIGFLPEGTKSEILKKAKAAKRRVNFISGPTIFFVPSDPKLSDSILLITHCHISNQNDNGKLGLLKIKMDNGSTIWFQKSDIKALKGYKRAVLVKCKK